jgi:hypothetical protein
MSKESIVLINGHEYRYQWNPQSKAMEYLGPVGNAPSISQEQFQSAMTEHFDHYTPEEREAIMNSPEYIEWEAKKKNEIELGAVPTPKKGFFHAFMTDVGKGAVRIDEKTWPGRVNRSDKKGREDPQTKKTIKSIAKQVKERGQTKTRKAGLTVKFAESRFFQGEEFTLEVARETRKEADMAADNLRRNGFKVRVVYPKDKSAFAVYKGPLRG